METDERTVFIPRGTRPQGEIPSLEIQFPGADGKPRYIAVSHAVIIGRAEGCAIRIGHALVSRQHAEIFPEGETWWVRDLQSSNGTLVNGRAIDRLPLLGAVTLELGKQGPRIRILAPPPAPPPSPPPPQSGPPSLKEISDHYFGAKESGPAGERTLLIRKAYQDVTRRKSRVYLSFIGIALALLVGVGGVALFQYLQVQKLSALANDIFYGMKDLELYIANLEAELEGELEQSRRAKRLEEIAETRRRLAAMRGNYEVYVQEVRASQLIAPDSEQLLILHVARIFGETEVDVPRDFASEVRSYIRKWRSSSRLANAIQRLKENRYAPAIQGALTSQGLAPQFIYLALQESSFQTRAVGPPTRYGRAKGMWQFIPSTAERYGLRVGPLKDTGSYDPADDRHDFAKASLAAAKYLKYIYRTDAQASGLLVMASYNWGEGNIIKRIRQMPNNPRERNFWALLRHYKIPKETYDYVFYIFSAAVICENPRMFGFDFDNPLLALQ